MNISETATLAGGCFWCTEAIFKRLKGVVSVMPGYAGGTKPHPTYQEVCSGDTGHAETIQIAFDPTAISYKTLLEIFFHLHDPTTPNQQGNDVGTQYRSEIFYHSEDQRKTAESVKQQLEESGVYRKIVTEITPFTIFYPAEDYHQDYYAKNSYAQYCQYAIDPKIQKLLREHQNELKEEYSSAS